MCPPSLSGLQIDSETLEEFRKGHKNTITTVPVITENLSYFIGATG